MIHGYDIHITEATRTRTIGYLTDVRSRAADFGRRMCGLPTVKQVKVTGYDDDGKAFVVFSFRKSNKPSTLKFHEPCPA